MKDPDQAAQKNVSRRDRRELLVGSVLRLSTDPVTGDHVPSSSSNPADMAECTIVPVPAGAVFGSPVKISLMAGPPHEPALRCLACAFAQAARHQRAPRRLPDLEFA